MANPGWQIWVQDGERLRQFTVAESDFKKAEAVAIAQVQGASQCYSYHEMSAQVIQFLGLPPGKSMEWVPGDRTSTIRPGGTTRGGSYDAQGT